MQLSGGHIINGDITVQTSTDEDLNLKIRQKMEVRNWIYSADSDTLANYNAAQKVHLPGTGSWFLEGYQFSEWKEQRGSVLWLYGGPGSGKTVLSSTIIANVIDFCDLTPLARGYAYFFFDARNDSEQPELVVHNRLTRSLITQLADRRGDDIPAALANMYRACDNGHRQPSNSLLEDTLLQLIEGFEDVYIVIDLLDECADRETLLKWIQSITSKASGKLHLMLTSRSDSAIERGLASLSGLRIVWIGDQLTAGDIRAYVNAEVAKMNRWNKPGERDMIEKALLDGSDGMFRWVALQAHDLNKCKSKRHLMKQLDSLPKGLDGAYTQIFERSENPDVLTTFLQWLAFSRGRMTVEEIAEVAAMDFDGAEGPLYDPDMRYRQPEDALTVCYGLVTEVGGMVELAHFSVKEYLIKRLKAEAEAQGITGEQLSHSVIAQTCLARLLYLDQLSVIPWSRDTFWHSEDPIHSSFPLCRYAAVNWISHFHSASADSTHHPRLLKLLLHVFAQPGTYAMICLRDLDSDGHRWRDHLTSNVIASPLYYACFAGLTKIVQHLINDGADINAVGGARSTPLIAAIMEGHLKVATLLLEKEADVNEREGYAPALWVATVRGHVKLVKLLLEKGANVNEEGPNVIEKGWDSALMGAIFVNHFELVKLLLEHGADVNVERSGCFSPLQSASWGGQLESAKLLLEKGANVNIGGEYCALLGAIDGDHLELAQLLLENGADANAEGFHSGTALQSVCRGGHLELAKLLLEKGANVNAEGGQCRRAALLEASAGAHIELVKLLLDKGADVNVEGGMALESASSGGHLELAKLLLENGADVNGKLRHLYSRPVLVKASMGAHIELAKLLVERGADVNAHGRDGVTALHLASLRGDLEFAKLLLEKGAHTDINGGVYGRTALLAAIGEGRVEIATLLVKKGADVNIEGRRYGTALSAAIECGYLELATLLLENGADASCKGGHMHSGKTALVTAIYHSHIRLAKLLLENGADVNAYTVWYGTALHSASRKGHLELAKLLLEKGANVNFGGGYFGDCALLQAIDGDHYELAQLLLENGADANAEGYASGTALQSASMRGHLELARLLLEKGAHVNPVGRYCGRRDTALQAASKRGHLEIVELLLKWGADPVV